MNFFVQCEIIRLLTKKSVYSFFRQRSIRILMLVSTVIVCGGLYAMYYLSYHQYTTVEHFTMYSRLAFNLHCTPTNHFWHTRSSSSSASNSKLVRCEPMADKRGATANGPLSPSDLLFNILTHGNMMYDDPSKTSQVATLLSKIMMNGIPMLGLDDYIALSDFVVSNLGKKGTQQLLNSPGYSDRFRNFLNIRHSQIRIAAKNCFSIGFLDYLQRSSDVIKVGDSLSYSLMLRLLLMLLLRLFMLYSQDFPPT